MIDDTIQAENIQNSERMAEARISHITRNSYLKEKFRLSLKSLTKRLIQERATIHSEWTAQEVLVDIMKGYNPKLPPVVLLEMTQFILEEWEKIHVSKNEIVMVA